MAAMGAAARFLFFKTVSRYAGRFIVSRRSDPTGIRS